MVVFTTTQVGKLIGVAPNTVAKWFDSGRLKGYRIPGSQDRRIPLEYLRSFLRDYDLGHALAALEAEHGADLSHIPSGHSQKKR